MKKIVEEIIELAKQNNIKIGVAESCTGGMIAAEITNVAGASVVFERGVVTYSNLSKCELLNVEKTMIEEFGAVSEEVALAMAGGMVENAKVDVALATTGIAGPKSNESGKPVGLVYISVAWKTGMREVMKYNLGEEKNRGEIRRETTQLALEMLRDGMKEES